MKRRKKNNISLGDMEEILSTSDLSKELSRKGFPCSESSIRNWVKNHSLPHLEIHGRFYFTLDSVIDWLCPEEEDDAA